MRANSGIEKEYRKKLENLVDEMHNSVLYFLKAEYNRNESRIVGDASPAYNLRKSLEALSKRWNLAFSEKAETIVKWFVTRASKTSQAALKQALKDAGITVDLKLSRSQKDALQAIIEANISLIKSISTEYFNDVFELTQRSVMAGRDIGYLTEELAKSHGITRRRASFIARDQNNKATDALARVQAADLGITEGIWVHVPGKKYSRASHMKMNGQRFNLAEGCYDPEVKRKVHCGELPGCNCLYKPIIPGLDEK